MREPKEPSDVVPGPSKKKVPGTPFQKGQKASGVPFGKGQSGNPGGRPTGYQEFRELCRARTHEAIDTLVECLADTDPKVRTAAAIALLDRGWGRPATTIEVGVTPESALAQLAAALTEPEDQEDP